MGTKAALKFPARPVRCGRLAAWCRVPGQVQGADDMSTEIAKPSRQKVQAKTASRPNKVSGRLAEVARLMVEEAMPYQEAAAQAGLTVKTVYSALRRPHFVRHLRTLREALLERICIENPQHLVQLRGQRTNMGAAVKAISTLEAMNQQQHSGAAMGGAVTIPGLVIVVEPPRPTAPPPPTLDITPTVDVRKTVPFKR